MALLWDGRGALLSCDRPPPEDEPVLQSDVSLVDVVVLLFMTFKPLDDTDEEAVSLTGLKGLVVFSGKLKSGRLPQLLCPLPLNLVVEVEFGAVFFPKFVNQLPLLIP